MSYDRVEYSDKTHFSTHSDEHHFSDDPVRNGNGVYNDYTVELKPKTYNPTFRFLCCECKNTKRVKFIMAGASVVFCMALVLIIISAVAHHKASKQTSNKKYGLIAYGPDESGLVSFNPGDHKTYMGYFNRLEAGVADYNTLMQAANLKKYIPCNDSFTKIPEGKVCMFTLEKFGERCQHYDMFGISEARPCILLVLKPEKELMPKPFDFTDGKNAEIKAMLENKTSDKSIPVSCEGKTEQDKALMNKIDFPNKIDYNPANGFPLYYLLQRETEGHIYPAVMVQFNSIPTHQKVTVKCTAWAQNFNDGAPQNSEVYSTEFSIILG